MRAVPDTGTISIAIVASLADSTGCRNTIFILAYKELVEDFCGGLPSWGLSWTRVHGVSNGIEFAYGTPAEIGTLGKVLPEQAVCVLI